MEDLQTLWLFCLIYRLYKRLGGGVVDSMSQQSDLDVDRLFERLVKDCIWDVNWGFSCCEYEILS